MIFHAMEAARIDNVREVLNIATPHWICKPGSEPEFSA